MNGFSCRRGIISVSRSLECLAMTPPDSTVEVVPDHLDLTRPSIFHDVLHKSRL